MSERKRRVRSEQDAGLGCGHGRHEGEHSPRMRASVSSRRRRRVCISAAEWAARVSPPPPEGDRCWATVARRACAAADIESDRKKNDAGSDALPEDFIFFFCRMPQNQ